jgi:hypothetical protein
LQRGNLRYAEAPLSVSGCNVSKKLPLFLIVAGLISTVQAHANDEAPAAKKPAKVKKICRTDTATGSIMPKRTCHSADEWAVIDKQNGAAMDRSREGSVRLGGNAVQGASMSDR